MTLTGVLCGPWLGSENFNRMKTKDTPTETADRLEMMAMQFIDDDDDDKEMADILMGGAHAIRHLRRTLTRLSHRVHTGYDFNADPDLITLEVGDMLAGSRDDGAASRERDMGQLIDERDAAGDAADTLASLVLRENIEWPDHAGKWQEAIDALIDRSNIKDQRRPAEDSQ